MAEISIEEKRQYLAECEPYASSPSWVDRVKNKMPDRQVHAIFNKFCRGGVFQKSENIKKQRKKQAKKNNEPEYHQISMFEYVEDLPYADE